MDILDRTLYNTQMQHGRSHVTRLDRESHYTNVYDQLTTSSNSRSSLDE